MILRTKTCGSCRTLHVSHPEWLLPSPCLLLPIPSCTPVPLQPPLQELTWSVEEAGAVTGRAGDWGTQHWSPFNLGPVSSQEWGIAHVCRAVTFTTRDDVTVLTLTALGLLDLPAQGHEGPWKGETPRCLLPRPATGQPFHLHLFIQYQEVRKYILSTVGPEFCKILVTQRWSRLFLGADGLGGWLLCKQWTLLCAMWFWSFVHVFHSLDLSAISQSFYLSV